MSSSNTKYHTKNKGFCQAAQDELARLNLNGAQTAAARAEDGPILIAAGAGSGKTRTLIARLLHFFCRGEAGGKMLAITFTNKAAREIEARLFKQAAAPQAESRPFIGTFHSLGYRILKEEAPVFGRQRNFSVFDEDDSFALIKRIVKSGVREDKGIAPARVRSKLSYLKNQLAETDAEEPENDLEKEVLHICDVYEKQLEENNAFDFDDLIEKTARLLKDNPETLKKYQERFRHILVDECQDVNGAQYELIRLLAKGHRSLFVIGDDAQAIYGFRNADFKYFLNFEKDWPGAKIFLLEENYRSSKNIIRAAGAVIENNIWQKRKALFTNNPEGTLVKVAGCGSPEEEAIWIAQAIGNLEIVLPKAETGIMYRTNAQSRAIEQALMENNLAYEIYGGVKFYERKEIKDILAGLRYSFNPKDGAARERLAKNLNKRQAEKIVNEGPAFAQEQPILELVGFFLKETDYLSQLARQYDNSEERIENIQELIRAAAEYEELTPPEGLAAFLQKASLTGQTDGAGGRKPSRIKLMTVHLAKGLEFNAVFLAGCEEGLLPHHKSFYESEGIEEERRLFYVAMTRARQELYLSFHNTPSRFLYEIPPELIEVSGEKRLPNEEDQYISLD